MAQFSGLGASLNPLLIQLGPVVTTALVNRFQVFAKSSSNFTRPVVYRPSLPGSGTATYSTDFWSPGQTAQNPFISSFSSSPSLPLMPSAVSALNLMYIDTELPRGSEIVVIPGNEPFTALAVYGATGGSTPTLNAALFWEEP